MAKSLHDLGCFHAVRGHHERAEALLREALALRLRLLGPDHRDVAETLRFLGEVLFDEGRYDEAQDALVDALDTRRRAMGDDCEPVDRDLLEIAQLHLHRGNLAAAEPLLELALGRNRQRRGEDHWLNATLLSNLAEVAEERGDPLTAEPLLRRALAIRRRVLAPEHPHVARSLVDLGVTLTHLGRFAAADSCLQEALRLDRRHQDADSPETVACLKAIADQREAAGDLEAAARFRGEALALDRQHLGPDHPDVAEGLLGLARLRRRNGDPDGAWPLVDEALAVLATALGAGHPALLSAYYEAASIHLDRGDLPAAARSLTAAARIFETARVQVGHGYARAFFSRSPYGRLAGVDLALGREQEAWEAAERSYGRALADLLQAPERAAAPVWPLPTGRRLLATPGAAAADVVSLEQVRGVLGPREAVIGMVAALPGPQAHGPWTFVIRRDAPLAWIEYDATATCATTGQEFLEALGLAAAWPFRVTDTRGVEANAHRLWRRWIAPLADHLRGIDHLVVIPSGPLRAIPLEALVDGDGHQLVDRFNISYVPSATILLAIREAAPPPRATPAAVLLVGDPPQDGSSSLPALPGAHRELTTLAEMYPGATVLAGSAASEGVLQERAAAGELSRYRFIHFATHALADDLRPDDSCLVLYRGDLPDTLAAAGSRGQVCDGYLTAGEIARDWHLAADLVTLSSCRSARGKVCEGEGYIGLAHAFLRAGARNLVVSLWDVEDEATARLMSRFYANLGAPGAAADPALALDEAKRWLRDYRDEHGATPFRHPAYWSSFVLLGGS